MINEGCHTASSEATNLIGDANSSLKKPSTEERYHTETLVSICNNIQEIGSLRKDVPSTYPVHRLHNQGTELLPAITPENPVHTSVHTVHVSSTEAVKALKPSDELYELYEVTYEVRNLEVENLEIENTLIMNSMNYVNEKQKVKE